MSWGWVAGVAVVLVIASPSWAHRQVVRDRRGDQNGFKRLDLIAAAIDDGGARLGFDARLARRVRKLQLSEGVTLRLDTYGTKRWDYFIFTGEGRRGYRCTLYNKRGASLGRGAISHEGRKVGCSFLRSRVRVRSRFIWNTFSYSGNGVLDYTQRRLHKGVRPAARRAGKPNTLRI